MTSPDPMPRHLFPYEGSPAELAASFFRSGDIPAAAMCLGMALHEEKVLEPAGWDAPPTLWLAERLHVGTRGAATAFGLVAALDANGTAGIAAQVADIDPAEAGLPADVAAWVLACETWVTPLPGADWPASAPGRFEARHVLAVDRAGYHYALIRCRDGDPTLIVNEAPGAAAMLGPVVDALAGLIERTPAEAVPTC
jgi:hypothetical protein